MYPERFLKETEDTLRLLFPQTTIKGSRWRRQITEKKGVDLEAGWTEIKAPLDLSRYKFWGSRLAEIQRQYDAAKPTCLRQWWYDRREPNQWITVWIGLIALISLTIVFGVIASVSGIMQVRISLKALKQLQ